MLTDEQFDKLKTDIENEIESRTEYEEKHDDAGNNYAECVRESLDKTRIKKDLAKYLSEQLSDLDVTDHIRALVETVVFDTIETDSFEMFPGGIWGIFKPCFVIDSFAVEEVENQLSDELLPLIADCSPEQWSILDREFCLHRYDHDGKLTQVLSYDCTDAVWYAGISKQALIDSIKEAINKEVEDLTTALDQLPSADKEE